MAQKLAGREALLAEFRASRESLLQACWAQQLWRTKDLQTTDGRVLLVDFPGWLNRESGPDFTQARLTIGGNEWFGDVEVHLDERGWRQHGHDRDARYGKVILHVVLDRAYEQGAESAGRAVALFHAAPVLPLPMGRLLSDSSALLASYASAPGRCGLRAALEGPEAANAVIAHAAEARARQKAERLAPLFEQQQEEQILFELLFQSLGYRPYAATFVSLARRFPLASLRRLLDLPVGESRTELLCRWFGTAGLLKAEFSESPDPEAREEYARLRGAWLALGLDGAAEGWRRKAARPWNAPERRIVGMFHHLHRLHQAGWLRGWLGFLVELDRLRDEPRLRRCAVRALERLFDVPESEPWRQRVSFHAAPLSRSARLIGTDRVIILVANAVIPFFLARARRMGDSELEKLLYRLFIVLPPEAPNVKTRFMEQRLALSGEIPKSLRMQQGLLQIHHDFCTSFEAGCENCAFPDLVTATGRRLAAT